MKNPGFQEYFFPVLKQLSNGKEQERNDIIEAVAASMNLSKEVRQEMLPTQTQKTYANRIGWSLTYLKKAGLVETPSRGMWKITKRGNELYMSSPTKLNVAYLKENFEEFKEFQSSKKNKKIDEDFDAEETVDDKIMKSYDQWKQYVYDELIEEILKRDYEFFEKLVVELIVKMGYGGSRKDAGEALGKSGDEGLDGIIKEDVLGLDEIYIQAKRYANTTVGRPEIQKFVGALSGKGSRKGIFITTSTFSKEAQDYQAQNNIKVILIDKSRLVQLMYDYGIGVYDQTNIILKKVDLDFFD